MRNVQAQEFSRLPPYTVKSKKGNRVLSTVQGPQRPFSAHNQIWLSTWLIGGNGTIQNHEIEG